MSEYGRYEEVVKGLNWTIHQLIWLGKFWGKDGALNLNKIRNVYVKKISREREYLSTQSSLYYSAKGNAESRAVSTNKLFALYWLLISYRCFNRAVCLSDQLVQEKILDIMTNGELITRSTIMKAARRWADAQICIDIARGRDNLSSSNKVLLMIDEADMLATQDKIDEAYAHYEEAMCYADSSLLYSDNPGTHVRLCKSYARFLMKYRRTEVYPKAKDLLSRAKKIAEREGLTDQIVKIEAIEEQIMTGN